MTDDIQAQLDAVSLAVLKQDARFVALQITIAELLRLEGEQLEAFNERYLVHESLQMQALAERLRVRHPSAASDLGEAKDRRGLRGPPV